MRRSWPLRVSRAARSSAVVPSTVAPKAWRHSLTARPLGLAENMEQLQEDLKAIGSAGEALQQRRPRPLRTLALSSLPWPPDPVGGPVTQCRPSAASAESVAEREQNEALRRELEQLTVQEGALPPEQQRLANQLEQQRELAQQQEHGAAPPRKPAVADPPARPSDPRFRPVQAASTSWRPRT